MFSAASLVRSGLLRRSDRISEQQAGQATLILRIGVRDIRFGLLQFGLPEFNDRTETEVVARLRQVQPKIRLVAKLLCEARPFERLPGLLPRDSSVARDTVTLVHQFLPGDLGFEVCRLGPRVVEKSAEHRNVNVRSRGSAPVWQAIIAHRRNSHRAEGADRRPREIVLCAGEFRERRKGIIARGAMIPVVGSIN